MIEFVTEAVGIAHIKERKTARAKDLETAMSVRADDVAKKKSEKERRKEGKKAGEAGEAAK